MFKTLKARRGNSGKSEYIVESASPPFIRNRTKKPHACTLCKVKKLKCVVEADSCVKCLKQGLQCSYRSTAMTDLTSDSTSSAATSELESQILRSVSHQSGTSKSTADSSNPSLSAHHGEPSFSDGFLFPDLPHCDNYFDFTNDSSDIDDASTWREANDSGETQSHSGATVFPLMHPSEFTNQFPSRSGDNRPEEGAPAAPFESSQMAPTSVADTSSGDLNPFQNNPQTSPPAAQSSSKAMSQVDVLFTQSYRAEPRGLKPPQPLPAICHCLDQIMSANEAMQVKLVWGASSRNGLTVSVDDILQCQKEMLTSCETLLNCGRCRLRGDYLIMIVSMCQEMMNGLNTLSALTLPGSQQHGSSKRPRSDANGGKLTTTKRGLKAGGWQLDDEDEMQVIRSLIGIRIKRLSGLVSQLEKAVNANHSSYQWIIRALKQVIAEHIADIGSGRDSTVFVQS